MKKRIDVVLRYFYPVAAGIETNVMETYTVLAEMGWDVHIITTNDTYTESETLKSYELIRGLHVHRYPYKQWSTKTPIEWDKVDLVCLHNFDIIPHGIILARILWMKLAGKKKFGVTLTPHGGFNPSWETFSLLQKTIKWAYTYTIGTLLINAVVDKIRAVSEWERREMEKYGLSKKKITVIANGLEDDASTDIEKLASPEIRKLTTSLGTYIIQVGRLYRIKNYETTIRSLVDLPKNVNYVIMGPVAEQSYVDFLKNLAKELRVMDRVIFIGVKRGIDKYYLIRHALAMVHMAIYESFCNVVHEGMSQGLPCIVANNTALPLLIKDGINGYLVETHDSKTLSEKILRVLDPKAKEEIAAIRKTNSAYALSNSWRNVAEKMDTLYTSI